MATRPLRSAIESLAAIDRSSCSSGEREAAEWICAALKDMGLEARVEIERVHGTYWWPLGITAAMGVVADMAARRGRRLFGAALAGSAVAAVMDELSVGRRVLRRLLPKRITANVVAVAGDPTATQTLIVVAHHDAAHTSVFFDPRIAALMGSQAEEASDEARRMPPVMAPIALAPAMVAAGALAGSGRLARLGSLTCIGIIASFVEIAVRPTVPGANDNLTGVATVLEIARVLREQPIQGLRVLLVSTGAEESLMEGMRAFAARHFGEMAPGLTHVLCVDTVGSPHLVLAEAEGMLRMRGYDSDFNGLIEGCARAEGVPIRRGLRMRFGTDGVVALRHRFPAAMLTSVDEHGAPSNYHRLTDTPDRVDYERLDDAVKLCSAVLQRLARQAVAEGGDITSADPVQRGVRRPTPAAP